MLFPLNTAMMISIRLSSHCLQSFILKPRTATISKMRLSTFSSNSVNMVANADKTSKQLVRLIFEDKDGEKLGMLRVEHDELTTKSLFLTSLCETSSNKSEVVVPLNNFENPEDVVSFLTTWLYKSSLRSDVNYVCTEWLDYAIHFQMHEVQNHFKDQATQFVNKVISHYSALKPNNRIIKQGKYCDVLSKNEIDLFWKLINMSYNHPIFEDFDNLGVYYRLAKCDALLEETDVIITRK